MGAKVDSSLPCGGWSAQSPIMCACGSRRLARSDGKSAVSHPACKTAARTPIRGYSEGAAASEGKDAGGHLETNGCREGIEFGREWLESPQNARQKCRECAHFAAISRARHICRADAEEAYNKHRGGFDDELHGDDNFQKLLHR